MKNSDQTQEVDFEEFLKDPEIRTAFEDAQFRSDIIGAITAARKRAGKTQAAVAKEMGTTQSAVSDLENGGDPHFSTLQRYARASGTRIRFYVDCVVDGVTEIVTQDAIQPKNHLAN